MSSHDPFSTPANLRDPARRFRGRLAAPVTTWTSGPSESRRGLTVSSILVAEGDAPGILGLVNPMSDLWDALEQHEVFVVHVLERRHRKLAERFAGALPSPGGLFRALSLEDTRWGPKLLDVPNRAYCTVAATYPVGYQHLVHGAIEGLEFDGLEDPLAYFRGRYRGLAPPRAG
jgi:3-hydroxy-9,10-secoandrosta-1,3,5(10)-triene-9,17-dione monooxygenase reductase component